MKIKKTPLVLVAIAGALITTFSHAAIVGPYSTDANTLHLYHLDEASGAATADAAGSINTSAQSGATLGNTGFTGFGNAGNTNAANNSIIRSSVNTPGPVVAPVGAGGAFTYEAMINVSGTTGNQQIFAMDANANGDRNFLFRINNGNLNFFNLKQGFLTSYGTAIPTTGDDAFVAGEWFHVAVTYNGNENTANNLKLYWTRVDASRTEANLIGSHNMAEDLSTTAVAIYGIGNDFRTVGSGNVSSLDGSIDEVRISGIARAADEMLFAAPPENFIYHDSATTDGGEFNSSFPIGNLKNAGHTSSGEFEDAGDNSESYATANPPTGGYPVTITLEFDGLASLEAFHLWNHSNNGGSGATANGVGDFTLTFFAEPNGGGSQIGTAYSSTALAAPATGTYAAQSFDFGTTYSNVRSVVFRINDKANDTASGFVAMREIGFTGTTTPIPPANPDKVIVYLVGGQSNADGYGVTSQLSSELQDPQPDIDLYHGNGGGNSPLTANQVIRLQPGTGSMGGNAGGFGPELSFGIDIHEALGSEGARIAIIKHTVGGTSLNIDWSPGGDNTTSGDGPVYQAFQNTVTDGLAALAALYPAAAIEIEGMIWHQGEADTGGASSAGIYQTNLTNFIADVRATFDSDLKFGIAQLSDNQTALDPTRRATVKAAQAAVADADALSYLVTTDDVPVVGTIHFGTAGNLTIGSRLAAGMQEVPITDGDPNGLDDDWEELYWGTGNTGQDPTDDDDKDGLSNLEEFLWLTNPLVSNVVPAQLQTTPGLSISWPSSPERRYLIELSSDLASWQRIDSFIPGDAGASTSYDLPEAPGESKLFYRIEVQR